jgi:hypothetical protein
MNTMLPTPRDLPPRRRDEIRIDLQRAIEGESARRRVRLAPLVTALAVLAGVVVAVAPWQGSTPPAGSVTPPVATAASTPPPPTTTSTVDPTLVLVDPPVPDVKAIEAGCSAAAGRGPATLYNTGADQAGRFALLYNQDTALNCTLDDPGTPYNSGFAGLQDLHWLSGEVVIDVRFASVGGSVPGGKAEYQDRPGTQIAAGRVSSQVGRVTYTEGGRTVDAVVANGTFYARIIHPATWKSPEVAIAGLARAYDANGRFLGESAKPGDACYATPDGEIIGVHSSADPKNCLPAIRWR